MVKKLHANNKQRNFKVFKLDLASIYRKLFAWIQECFDRLNLFSTNWSKGSKCVGIEEWSGNKEVPDRAFFPLPIDIHSSLSPSNVTFFNAKLLEIGDDFINKTLGSNYISLHTDGKDFETFKW